MAGGANYNLVLLGIFATAVILWAHYKVRPKIDLEFRFKEFFLVIVLYNIAQAMYMSLSPGTFQVINSVIKSIGFFTVIYSISYALEVFVHNHFEESIPPTYEICTCECSCCLSGHLPTPSLPER